MNEAKILCAIFCAAILLAACSKQNAPPSQNSRETSASPTPQKLRVLATFAPIFSFTKNVAGDAADVEMLLPPNVAPQDFALSPSDLKKIATADVVVENGFGLEAWLDRAAQGGLKKGAVRIVAARGIEPMENSDELSMDEKKSANETEENSPNPHVWLDPVLAIKEVENIRDGLSKKDPANGDTYLANANVFSTKLRDLDDEIGRSTVNLANKEMLTFRDSFSYFAARYGFEIVGIMEPFPGREPTPRFIEKLREIIASKNVRALFSEPQCSPQILQSLSQDAKLPIVVLDPMETGEPSADFYENVSRKNLNSLVDSLK